MIEDTQIEETDGIKRRNEQTEQTSRTYRKSDIDEREDTQMTRGDFEMRRQSQQRDASPLVGNAQRNTSRDLRKSENACQMTSAGFTCSP